MGFMGKGHKKLKWGGIPKREGRKKGGLRNFWKKNLQKTEFNNNIFKKAITWFENQTVYIGSVNNNLYVFGSWNH